MFETKQFDNLIFPIHKKDPDKIRGLGAIKAFRKYEGEYRSEVIRYIVYLYDMNSPLRTQLQDVSQRKKEAAILAGFDLEKKAHKEILTELFTITGEDILEMIVGFIRFQNNRVWAMIVSNEEAFYEYQSKLLAPVREDKAKAKLQALQVKSKLMEDSADINDRLEMLYKRLAGDDDDLAAKMQARKFTPEAMAGA